MKTAIRGKLSGTVSAPVSVGDSEMEVAGWYWVGCQTKHSHGEECAHEEVELDTLPPGVTESQATTALWESLVAQVAA